VSRSTAIFSYNFTCIQLFLCLFSAKIQAFIISPLCLLFPPSSHLYMCARKEFISAFLKSNYSVPLRAVFGTFQSCLYEIGNILVNFSCDQSCVILLTITSITIGTYICAQSFLPSVMYGYATFVIFVG
jgi:hypothetical protein